MFGSGPGKLGRGGGRRPQSSFHPPPLPSHRASAQAGRPSLGGGTAAPRTRPSASSPSSKALPAVEETFNLVTGNPSFPFAAIIRLAPDLVDEIKRAEAQGGAARIKFDSNASNAAGNAIEAGGKNFRFTWSHESPDLCDIYEERQSGKDGNGLLVESGCAQRKVNVQRILDESTQNHVKMRSEEAEKKLKSRQAIVLDPANPSMKNQMKAIADADANSWKSGFRQKKEPPYKKRKAEPMQAPPKPAFKAGPSVAMAAKGRDLPPHSSHEQFGASASPTGAKNVKGHTATETSVPELSKGSAMNLEKKMPNKAPSAVVPEKLRHKGKLGAPASDLQSMALEKAFGDMIPNSVKKIEPILKKIANFQAPGRYILKSGVGLGSFKKPSLGSESSPEDNQTQTSPVDSNYQQSLPMEYNDQQTPPVEDNHNHGAASETGFTEKPSPHDLEDPALLNSELGGEPTPTEGIDTQRHLADLFGETKVSDNSEGQTGSSSDSGSVSDSESDSSDSGSDSGSHSGSDSDASNSKQGSDQDVDIVTSDDDKESKPKLQTDTRSSLLSSPRRSPEGGTAPQSEADEKHDGHEIAMMTAHDSKNKHETPVQGNKAVSPYQDGHGEDFAHVRGSFAEMEGTSRADQEHDQSDRMDRSHRGKHRKASDVKHFDGNAALAKKPKPAREAQHLDAPNDLSHVTDQMMSRTDRDENGGSGIRPSSKRDVGSGDGFSTQNHEVYRDSQVEDNYRNDKNPHAIFKDGGVRKQEFSRKLVEAKQGTSSQIGLSPKDRGRILQRELSVLELGELREPLPEGTPGPGKKFERKASSKQLENRLGLSDSLNSGSSKGNPVGKACPDLIKMPSPDLGIECRAEDSTSVGHAEAGPRVNKLTNDGSRSRKNEAGMSREAGFVEYRKTPKTAPASLQQQSEIRHGPAYPSKENISKKSEVNGCQKDSNSMEIYTNGGRRKESSSDESSCPYSKYGKDDPELRGPIKDYSQYLEYLHEYREKYDSYLSLHKILENYRNGFSKLGREIEAAKTRDMQRYYKFLSQLLESYHQCGAKQKRLAKIFVVLHEEVKHLKQRIRDFAEVHPRKLEVITRE